MAADWRTASVEATTTLPDLTAALDVGERLEGLVERECSVEDRAQTARVVEGGELAELGAIGPHEEERVTHTRFLAALRTLRLRNDSTNSESFGAQLLANPASGGPATPIASRA